jgi:hypothetical protein
VGNLRDLVVTAPFRAHQRRRYGSTVITVERPGFRGVTGAARSLAVAGLAGVISGILVGGVGGRLFMRLAAAAAGERARGAGTEAGFTVGEITLEGTLGLLLFVGVVSGILGAAWFVIFRPWLAWAGRWRGPVFGVLVFALASATSDVLKPDNVDFLILRNAPLVLVLIATLFVAFGLVIVPMDRTLDRRLPPAGSGHAVATAVYVVLALLGLLLGGALLFQTLFTTNMCACDPPIAATVGTIAAGIGTALWFVSGIRGTPAPIAGAVRWLGVGGLAIASAGLVRAVSDAVEVLRT